MFSQETGSELIVSAEPDKAARRPKTTVGRTVVVKSEAENKYARRTTVWSLSKTMACEYQHAQYP